MRIKILSTAIIFVLALGMLMPLAFAQEAAESAQIDLNDFAGAFQTIDENSLPGDLPWLLWLIAQESSSAPLEPDAALTPLAEAAAKFAALIRTQGVYYMEITKAMGMEIKAEYWMKGEQYKKVDPMQDEVTIFDGTWFYKYSPKKKTGVRLPPDDQRAMSAISSTKNYTLAAMAQQPYEQQEDKKIKPFDCQVFYMDMEFMDMKGNWLYIDKTTGALIKNQFGQEKGGMSVSITKLEVGKFGDEAFIVPDKIKITGP